MQELKNKYPDISNLSKKEREKIFNNTKEDFLEGISDIVDDVEFDFENEKTEYFVKETFKQAMLSEIQGKRPSLHNIVKKVVLSKGEHISDECLAKFTNFANVDDINVIKTDTNADRSQVKLELVYEDDTSKKVVLELENTQKEWKVTDPGFHLYLW